MSRILRYLLNTVLAFVAVIFLFSVWAIFISPDYDYTLYEPTREEFQAWLAQMEVEEEEALTADALKKICSSKHEADDGFCTGFMLGFVEGHGNASNIRLCDNGSLRSADQVKQIFANYMEDHPQHWKKPRSFILGASLQEAFPCSTY